MALTETEMQQRIERTIILVRQGFVPVEEGKAQIERLRSEIERFASIR